MVQSGCPEFGRTEKLLSDSDQISDEDLDSEFTWLQSHSGGCEQCTSALHAWTEWVDQDDRDFRDAFERVVDQFRKRLMN